MLRVVYLNSLRALVRSKFITVKFTTLDTSAVYNGIEPLRWNYIGAYKHLMTFAIKNLQ